MLVPFPSPTSLLGQACGGFKIYRYDQAFHALVTLRAASSALEMRCVR